MSVHPIETLFAGLHGDPAVRDPLAPSGVLMMDGQWRPLRPLALRIDTPPRQAPIIVGIPVRHGRGRVADLVSWATLPMRVRACERALAKGGCHVTRYAVDPSLEAPNLVFELGSIAEEYALKHLLGHSGRWTLVRRALAWWLGTDPSVGGIVLIGTPR